VGKTSQLRKC